MKNVLCTLTGIAGAFVANIFGGWSSALTTLVIFMAIDYITGLVVAGVFHTSPKTANGSLESRAGLKGLSRKCMVLLYVVVAYRLDMIAGTTYIKDAVCICFIVNEALSITENAGLMGLPIPKPITEAIELLQHKDKTT